MNETNNNTPLFPTNLPSYTPNEAELNQLHQEAVEQKERLDKVFADDEETIDEETGEVTTKPKDINLTPAPTGYKAIVITMPDEEAETKAEIEKRALTNPRLAEALKSGKKTWDGFFRFWHNKTRDAHKEFNIGNGNALVVHREDVWNMAEEYFTNDQLRDINPASVKKPKVEKKPKAEPKPKKSKTIPLTEQMGSLFTDDMF